MDFKKKPLSFNKRSAKIEKPFSCSSLQESKKEYPPISKW